VLAVTRPLVTRLELVVETDAHEGPVYAADEHALYFTTTRRGRVSIMRLDLATRSVSVVRADANNANGMVLDAKAASSSASRGTSRSPRGSRASTAPPAPSRCSSRTG
jgi:gluconolactonase